MIVQTSLSTDLGRLWPSPRSGHERFHANGQPVGPDLLSFWRWSASDLISNTMRGILAEFIVANALGIPTESARDAWGAYDLETLDGIKVEVKSSAYIQSWHQKRFSAITFGTRKTRYWDADTNRFGDTPKRQADVYVFALLAHRDKRTIDPMNLDQWQFFVVATHALDARTRSQDSITLPTLQRMSAGPYTFGELASIVRDSVTPNAAR